MKNLIFVDCEATGPCPGKGELTEFGAVEYESRQTFHGVLFEARPRADNPALSELRSRQRINSRFVARPIGRGADKPGFFSLTSPIGERVGSGRRLSRVRGVAQVGNEGWSHIRQRQPR